MDGRKWELGRIERMEVGIVVGGGGGVVTDGLVGRCRFRKSVVYSVVYSPGKWC